MFFSVIVPIYKTEEYLKQCVDSVLAQTFDDYELILVDDGSPDNCGAICDDYATKDSRVKVIHKPNGGLVSARKAGIEIAQGQYVINIDSDDWVEPTYFAKTHEIIALHNPDVVAFAVNYCYEDHTETKKELVESGFYDRDAIESKIIPNMLLTKSMTHMHYYVWAKAFRREVVTPNQMAVDERISMGEDVSVLMPTYLDAQSVFISDDAIYDCRCHSLSMSRKFNPRHYRDIELGAKLLRTRQDSAPKVFGEEIDRYVSFMCFVLLASCAEAGAKDDLPKIEKSWCEEFAHSFDVAQFDAITSKSKMAISLLKKGKIKRAYSFLRLCSKIKKG